MDEFLIKFDTIRFVAPWSIFWIFHFLNLNLNFEFWPVGYRPKLEPVRTGLTDDRSNRTGSHNPRSASSARRGSPRWRRPTAAYCSWRRRTRTATGRWTATSSWPCRCTSKDDQRRVPGVVLQLLRQERQRLHPIVSHSHFAAAQNFFTGTLMMPSKLRSLKVSRGPFSSQKFLDKIFCKY